MTKYLALMLFFISVLYLPSGAWAEDKAMGQTASKSHAESQYAEALSAWHRTLTRFVDEQGRVNFVELADDLDDLRSFVQFVEANSPSSNPSLFPTREHVLAYHINAYNALAMMGVIERGIPKNFSSFFKRASFFKFRKIVIGGKKTNLYDYENKVIRPLDEPRLHFALNCMVRDCPRLPMKPFTADELEQQLESVTLEFFSKPKHITIDSEKRVLRVSSILDFYTKDFVASGKRKDLGQYIDPYVTEDVSSGYKIQYIDYDWTINQQP